MTLLLADMHWDSQAAEVAVAASEEAVEVGTGRTAEETLLAGSGSEFEGSLVVEPAAAVAAAASGIGFVGEGMTAAFVAASEWGFAEGCGWGVIEVAEQELPELVMGPVLSRRLATTTGSIRFICSMAWRRAYAS